VSIAFGPYPENGDFAVSAEADEKMAMLQAVISAARTIRSEHEVHPGAEVPFAVRSASAEALSFLRGHAQAIRVLVKSKGAPEEGPLGAAGEPGTTVSVVPSKHGPIEVLVGLKGLVTKDKELLRIARELKKIEKDVTAIDKKLGSPAFVERAPKEVVE